MLIKGKLPKKDYNKIIAIIGSRKANIKELNAAYVVAQNLSERGHLIISGLAKGIDRYSHIGALSSSDPTTVAILNTCIHERIYPPINQQLAEDILKQGLLVFPYDDPSSTKYEYGKSHTQFQRRLIERSILTSYIADSIIVISDNDIITGGTRWTAKYALKNNKKVIQINSDLTRKKNIKISTVNLYWTPELNFENMSEEIISYIRRK